MQAGQAMVARSRALQGLSDVGRLSGLNGAARPLQPGRGSTAALAVSGRQEARPAPAPA